MLTSLALIFLVGLAMSAICKQIRLPGIIGMLATGIVLGPYVLDLLSPSILGISADLRKISAYHHSAQGRIVVEPLGFKEGGTPGNPDVVCAGIV